LSNNVSRHIYLNTPLYNDMALRYSYFLVEVSPLCGEATSIRTNIDGAEFHGLCVQIGRDDY
jgi:hypothetical protein